VLNAKGGSISYHLKILKTVKLELLICQNTLIVKIWSLVGEFMIMGKRESFWILIIFTRGLSLLNAQTSEFDLEIGK
jgi:hypothetical protein